MKKKAQAKKDIFFPYYVNQGILLDIYAILNQGYSDYEEISQEKSVGNESKVQGEVAASAGFKLLKISSNLSAENYGRNDYSNSIKIKKVQTITSILSIVLSELKNNNYLKKIDEAKVGSFITIPVVLQINSLKNIFTELSDIIKLISDIGKMGVETGIKSSEIKNYESITKSLKSLVNTEEIIYEDDSFAITGTISEKHYYQGTKADIIDTEIMCLAQVKKIFPNGTELMKDNKLGLIKDASIKNSLIECVNSINKDNTFSFSSTAVAEIKNKPVYEIEIIALYQTESNDN